MRGCLVLLIALVATANASPGVKVWQASDPAITEGETVVDGDPAAAYAICTDYAKWVEVFPDIAKVVVNDHKGVDAHVTLVGPNGHRDNLHFQNQPAARMIYFEDTGNGGHADVWAEIVFAPGEAEHTTKLHIRLYANVKGLASLVVRDKDVRAQREQKIERQLSHVRGYFARMAKR
jgi:carbon monoxide dehydrogenase subunit G